MIFNILGDGLDSLLLSHQLISEGNQVLVYGDENRFGGHFLGQLICFDYLDSGMVLIEKEDRGVSQKKLVEYNGEYAQSSRPFQSLVFEYLQSMYKDLDVHKVYIEKSKGLLTSDYFISDNVEPIREILSSVYSGDQLTSLCIYLESLPKHLNPKNKLTEHYFKKTRLVEGLKDIYTPQVFDLLFASYLKKFDKNLDLEISLLDHRKLWVPLYYPETILRLLSGVESFLEPIQFFRPSFQSIASVIARMKGDLLENNNFRISPLNSFIPKRSGYGIQISFLSTPQLVAIPFFSDQIREKGNLDISTLSMKSSNHYLPIFIVHFCLAATQSQTVFCADETTQVYRYSIFAGGPSGSVCSLEISTDFGVESDLLAYAKNFCLDRGLDIMCQGSLTRTRIPLSLRQSSGDELKTMLLEQYFERAFEELGIIGKITKPFATAFNDNVLRMLYARDLIQSYKIKE